ncbi:hypothetical protein ABKV19_018938 [Rosa sericea]
MRTVVSRLIHSRSSLPSPFMMTAPINGRYLSGESNKVDEPFKVEEAETIQVPPPPTEKLLVLGGNGFVGSHVCREALDRGLSVGSLSRSGRSKLHDSWANNVTWYQGNLLSPDSWKDALDGVTSVRAAETEILTKFPYGGVILRPGFIYGTRSVGSIKLPLGVIGSPLEMLFQQTRPLNQLPLVGPLFTPPVNVTAVAKVAVRAATDPVFPPGIVDIYGIQRYTQHKSK